MSHDDRAADVTLPEILAALYDVGACMDEDCDEPVCVVRKVREAIAAGSAVVKVGEPPPWMEQPSCWSTLPGGGESHGYAFLDTGLDQVVAETQCFAAADGDYVPLYRLTEGNDRG